MPNSYTNDIDIYVPMGDLARFFECINNLDGIDSKLVILISRFGLIKCELLLNDVIIPFDVLYGFYYAGLEYQECDQLSFNSKIHSCGLFSTPCISDEVRISLLKELLHNGRVRRDKAAYLLENMDKCADDLPTDYFEAETIKIVREAIISANYDLPKVSRALKIRLLAHNLRKDCVTTLKNIVMFVIVKYALRNNYHKIITRL
ncbi:hypothetical protein OAE49_06760 [Gammaproteobacteria bacterium]|nr:hypothetical protein [Gammaproteobacteria bacterium]